MQAGEEHLPPVRGAVARELSRRDFLRHTTVLGAGALVASALPFAGSLVAPARSEAAVALDGATLQAVADTLIPGRKALRTDLGDEIDPRAILGVDPEPGAVEADALRLFRSTLLGFPLLAPVFNADLTARALLEGGLFIDLPWEKRVNVLLGGLSFSNPTRLVWEAAAAIPFVAFCAAGTQHNATSKTHSGLRVMGHPGTAPSGYRSASYRRALSKERTKKGYLR